MCKLQKCRIYQKSQVKNIGEGCGNLVKQEICPNYVLLRVNDLFKASYISKQRFNALYAAFESCVHGALKVAFHTVLGFRARGSCNQPHRRCLPLTGSEGNATMLNPTVRKSNYCSHHPHRRLADQGVFLRFSQWWRTLPITYAYTKREDSDAC